jgi:cellulose synthase/poly-beta-1,6-N-acetylglucosamine synthase-like glycosyltransferase
MRSLSDPATPTIVGLIASKNASPALIGTVASLFAGGAERVVVIDDGSDSPDSAAVFDQAEAAGALVIHLPENAGKAAALRVGFGEVAEGSLIVQVDDDTLAGDLSGPAQMILDGKADIVDIRVETTKTGTFIGWVQELNYWMTNAFVKRLQDVFKVRLWMSGASVMYTYEVAKVLLLEPARTMTEDTEGLYRARSKGFDMRYCSKKASTFTTMVPETVLGLRRQWQRWATGSGQVMGIYGLGGGLKKIAIANCISWINLLVIPIPFLMLFGVESALLWMLGFGAMWGIAGSIFLKRARLVLVGVFLPLMSVAWAIHAVEGLYRARSASTSPEAGCLTWESPVRAGTL